jgi:two-component system, chemotaxis family, chemotaxis protein CheY
MSTKKLLIVDDQEIFRKQFIGAVNSLGLEDKIEIFEAENGVKGIEEFGKLNVDFLVVDVHMPEMDGVTMLEKLNEQHQDSIKNTVIFMITTEADASLKEKGRQLGVESWILKPINVIKFFGLLDRKYLS